MRMSEQREDAQLDETTRDEKSTRPDLSEREENTSPMCLARKHTVVRRVR